MDFDDPTILELIEATDTEETTDGPRLGSDSDLAENAIKDRSLADDRHIIVQESSDLVNVHEFM